MRTVRGLFLVSRTGDDSVCPLKTPPCVRSIRPRVYRHHAHMLKHMCAWCRCTRGRFERTHGGVLCGHTGFFSVPHRTLHHDHVHNQHPHTNTHTHTQHTPTTHSNTQHTGTHTTSHGDRDRDKEWRERERREDKREDKTRQDKMKEKMKEKKTEIMMWTDAESKFTQEKAKLAKLKYTRN